MSTSSLPPDVAEALATYDRLRDAMAEQHCCLDGGCLVKRPTGMHTNGGCRCPSNTMVATRMMHAGQQLADAVRKHLKA